MTAALVRTCYRARTLIIYSYLCDVVCVLVPVCTLCSIRSGAHSRTLGRTITRAHDCTGACGQGQVYDFTNTLQCQSCDIGFYQDLSYPYSFDFCIACPEGTTTALPGSTSDQCVGALKFGSKIDTWTAVAYKPNFNSWLIYIFYLIYEYLINISSMQNFVPVASSIITWRHSARSVQWIITRTRQLLSHARGVLMTGSGPCQLDHSPSTIATSVKHHALVVMNLKVNLRTNVQCIIYCKIRYTSRIWKLHDCWSAVCCSVMWCRHVHWRHQQSVCELSCRSVSEWHVADNLQQVSARSRHTRWRYWCRRQ